MEEEKKKKRKSGQSSNLRVEGCKTLSIRPRYLCKHARVRRDFFPRDAPPSSARVLSRRFFFPPFYFVTAFIILYDILEVSLFY